MVKHPRLLATIPKKISTCVNPQEIIWATAVAFAKGLKFFLETWQRSQVLDVYLLRVGWVPGKHTNSKTFPGPMFPTALEVQSELWFKHAHFIYCIFIQRTSVYSICMPRFFTLYSLIDEAETKATSIASPEVRRTHLQRPVSPSTVTTRTTWNMEAVPTIFGFLNGEAGQMQNKKSTHSQII